MRKSRTRESGLPVLINPPQRGSHVPLPRSSSADGKPRASYPKPVNGRSSSESRRPPSMAGQIHRGMSPACGKRSLTSGFLNVRGSTVEGKRTCKDPRPLLDKTYQNRCITNLVEFLIQNNYPHAVTTKKLLSPPKKDFELMFEFLCRYVEPKFLVVKIEEDAPRILKLLGYPFIVAKSTYLAVNRMTWPTLLGILTWLMGLNKFIMSLDAQDFFMKPDFENGDEQYNLVKYILESYANNEDDPEKDAEMFINLATQRYSPGHSVEGLEKTYESRQDELEKLNSEIANFKQLLSGNKKKEEDLEKLEAYVEKMKERIEQKQKVCEELLKISAEKETEEKDLEAKVANMEAIVQAQGFDGYHAQNFYAVQKQDLIKQLEEKMERVKKEEKKFWEFEIESAQIINRISANAQNFDEIRANICLMAKDAVVPLKCLDMPAAIKLVKEFQVDMPEFEMKPSSDPKSFSEWKQVMSNFQKIRDYVRQQKDCANKIFNAQNHYISELEMKISELKIQEDLVKAQDLQKKRDLEIKEKDFEQEIGMLEKKLAEVKSHCEKTHNDILTCEKEYSDLQKQIAESISHNQKSAAHHEVVHKRAEEQFGEAKNKARKFVEENNAFKLMAQKMMETTLHKMQRE